MKRWSGLLIMLMATALLMPTMAAAKATPKVEAEIKNVMKQHNLYYKAKDLKGIMSLYAKTPDVVSLGSEEDKTAIGHEQISSEYRKAFASIREFKGIETSNLKISASGNVAWLFVEIKAGLIMDQGKAPMDVKGRLTAVLKKTGKQWQFVQTHFSLVEKPMKITFEEIDVNKDGKIDYREITVVVSGLTKEQFKALDKNKDGILAKDEYSGYMSDEEMKAVWARPHNIF